MSPIASYTEVIKTKETTPLLLDLGAGKCRACKMMEPVLEELKKNYQGIMRVKFIDVWKNRAEAGKYKILLIPTQIFFSPDGKELFRNQGFYSKDQILNKWKELGYNLQRNEQGTAK
ncbi:thioredoxin family protein [Candidatus Riflebacteria bacterium]